ncbi:hypothetical protein N7520_000048 [Penicillium odoratum]|uniref:uncharacterized protein n=1 Tax=Penicillium odoratum TaxID=1167516 RepID=UPI002547C9CA|nr:uncharacterized protein N7520_000048 [Penicillium odoratum]KAJ5776802.1 hypothetical protein N7520_000048 [Penicillium odoratum]
MMQTEQTAVKYGRKWTIQRPSVHNPTIIAPVVSPSVFSPSHESLTSRVWLHICTTFSSLLHRDCCTPGSFIPPCLPQSAYLILASQADTRALCDPAPCASDVAHLPFRVLPHEFTPDPSRRICSALCFDELANGGDFSALDQLVEVQWLCKAFLTFGKAQLTTFKDDGCPFARYI